MEPLLALALLLILAVTAPRWGYDGRATDYSKEQRLAALGLAWAAGRRDARAEKDHA